MDKEEIMRWENKSCRPSFLFGIPCLHAKEIVSDAYLEKYINWNVYNKVMQKIKTNQNGGWMFEHKQSKENSYLPIINRNDLIKAKDYLWLYLSLFITDDMMHDHRNIMSKLSIAQQTFLTFYLFDDVMRSGSSNSEENWRVNGGFLQLIYEGYGEYVFDILDNEYMENSIEEAIIIKQHIEYNISEFAIVDENNSQVSYIEEEIEEMESKKILLKKINSALPL